MRHIMYNLVLMQVTILSQLGLFVMIRTGIVSWHCKVVPARTSWFLSICRQQLALAHLLTFQALAMPDSALCPQHLF